MHYERIDISMVYIHIIWSFVFAIYMITTVIAIYTICTDLKDNRGREEFIMALLVSSWFGLAYCLHMAIESIK
jgi:hypothetical protein